MINDLVIYKKTQNDIFKNFNVEPKYFLSVLDECSWEIIMQDDINLIKYDNGTEQKTNLIVQKSEKPFIVEKGGYTMVVAIDCVKVAFVFKNDLKK